MNRSILIVICDFLVLSAMSLSIGVGETASTPKGGAVVSRAAAQSSYIEQMHRELEKRALVQKEKAKIESELETLRTQLAQLSGDVDSRTMKLNETSRALLAARTTLQEKEKILKNREEKLARQEEALKHVQAQVRDISAKYEKTSAELRESREETAVKSAELKQSHADLAAVSGKLKTAEGKLRESEVGLAYARGSLSRTEKELADSRKREESATKTLYTRGVELEQTRVELANTKRLLAAAADKLSRTQGELDRTKKSLADSAFRLSRTQESLSRTRENLSRVAAESEARAENLADTRRRLAATEKLLRSDALTAYSAAAAQLAFHLKNARFMNDFELNETLYAPEITIGGKTYLPGAFRSLTGLLKRYAGYTRIVELAYSVKKPGTQGQSTLLAGPLWSLNAEPRACLFEIAKPAGTPLKALTGAELKKRGLQNLTLFKFGSFGTETASLNGRCSLPLGADNSYLHIRNSQRNASELPAEVGDYVVSKEGGFVGVIVSVSENTLEGREDALCYLYPASISTKDAAALPLNRNGEYYTGFAEALQKVLKTVTALDRGEKSAK